MTAGPLSKPSSTRRKPRGYVGRGHESLGSDILSIARILKMPEQVLGRDESEKLLSVDPNAWYPVEWMLSLMDKLDQSAGHFGLIRMGRTIFDLSHKERLREVAKSARDVIHGLDGMYHHANRGEAIGGWKVRKFEPGYAELEKTTPHHCVMEQGIVAGALAAVGCPSNVSQQQCLREGADSCIFIVSSAISDHRWDHELP